MKIINQIPAITLAFLITIPQVNAAKFFVDDLNVSITLSGEIAIGDAERLASIFMSNPNYIPNSLILNSPGGDVKEAIRIADLVKTLGIGVYTKPHADGACASSCFLIYAGALERRASGVDTIRVKGKKGYLSPLGIHRPFFRFPTDGPTGIQRQEQIMLDMRSYLAKSGVSNFLTDKMMSHASNDIYWLTANDIQSLGRYSPGLEEQLISNCNYNSQRDDNLSMAEHFSSLRNGVHRCIINYQVKTFSPLKKQAIDRMKKGWRPWK